VTTDGSRADQNRERVARPEEDPVPDGWPSAPSRLSYYACFRTRPFRREAQGAGPGR